MTIMAAALYICGASRRNHRLADRASAGVACAARQRS
jgi:hypothetical protein